MERHVVHRQRVELAVRRSAEEARAVHAQLTELCREELPRLLDVVLGEATRPSASRDGTTARHLRFERLEVDVSVPDAPDLRPVLRAHLEQRLRQHLERAVREALAAADSASGRPASLGSEVLDPGDAEARLLGHVLETGTLPWWAPSVGPGELARRLRRLLDEGGLWPVLAGGTPRQRVRRLFGAFRALAKAVAAMAAERAGVREQHLAARVPPPDGPPAPLWESAVDEAFTWVLTDASVSPVRAAPRALELAWEWTRGHVPPLVVAPQTPAHAATAGAPRASVDAPAGVERPPAGAARAPEAPRSALPPAGLRRAAQDGAEERDVASMAAPSPDASAGDSRRRAPAAVAAAAKDTALPRERERLGGMEADSQGARAGAAPGAVRVDGAGVVILHPFLRPFLTAVGLVDEAGGFREADARTRAVNLCHWLATGEPVEEEHPLALAKVLCGLSLDAVVEPFGEPSDLERAEGEAMLTHAASAWAALKSRAPGPLRQGFLRRPGLLTRDHDAARVQSFVLRLEARPWDILLERLPWGISHVRLSWMQALLRVER